MKKAICVLLFMVFMFCCSMITVSGSEIVDSGTCGTGLTWELVDDGTLTINGNGAMDDYRVQYYVTQLTPAIYYPWYSHRQEIQSVVISSGVTRIGNSAFTACTALEDVSISDTVEEIGIAAFAECQALHEIVLPDSVTTIGSDAFCECLALQNMTLSTGLIEIGSSAFFDCGQLKSVGEIPAGVTVLEERLFEECVSLSDVTLPTSLISIKKSVFYNCKALESISFPASLTEIGNGAFMNSGLKSVTIPGNLTMLGGKAFASTPLENVTMEYGLKSIPNGLFSGCNSLQDPLIPSSVKTIEDDAFFNSGIKNVVIPEGVESIGNQAFNTSVETISLPNSLISIGDDAFRGTFRSVHIPSGVQSIGCRAFGGRYIAEFTVSVDNGYFCSDDGILYNKDMTTLVQYPLEKSSGVSSFFVPNGVEILGEYALSGCYFGTVLLPDSLTEIGNAAFYNCDGIRSIDIPEGVTVIGNNAFNLCDNLSTVGIPSSVTGIGKQAFANCPVLSSVDYKGSRCQWNRIEIGSGNTNLTNAALTVNSEHVPSQQETVLHPATCTEEGEREITVRCSVCDEFISSYTESIPMAPHVLIHHEGKSPTVTESGWEPYDTCENCDYTTYREIPAITPDLYEGLEFAFLDGILTVSGSGTVPTVQSISDTPLADYAEECKVIIIDDGITSVASNAFNGFGQVQILILRNQVALDSDAFETNGSLTMVICAESVQMAADTFSGDTSILFFESKTKPHTGISANNINVIPYSYADDTLTFDGRVAMDTYGLLDLMAVMCGFYEPIRFISFTSYMSLDVPFYVYNKTQDAFVPAENNTLEGVRFSVKISDGKEWTNISFNDFCALAETQELNTFRLVADMETGEEIQDNDFEITEEEPKESIIKRVLKWITSLLNKLFSFFSK
ncbi:MAG: leucine-rich repeat domain-containing protein [Clostridia bacterium]|nr:leucine-rich repeat domain-containing protein [Clostridia bacterium]